MIDSFQANLSKVKYSPQQAKGQQKSTKKV